MQDLNVKTKKIIQIKTKIQIKHNSKHINNMIKKNRYNKKQMSYQKYSKIYKNNYKNTNTFNKSKNIKKIMCQISLWLY